MRTPQGIRKVRSHLRWIWIVALAGLAWSLPTTGLLAQTYEAETWPTTRDPRYTPPVLPDGLIDSGGDNELLLLLNSGQGNSIEEFLEARRKAQLDKKRANNRYRERNTDRLLQRGQKGVVLERNLLEQFGAQDFPEDMGEYPYQETSTRRFTIVFLLALPVMAGFSYGLIATIKAINDDGVAFTNGENWATALLTLGGSTGIAWYDRNRVARLQELNRLPEPLEQRRGLIGDPPARPLSRLVPGGQKQHRRSQAALPLPLQFNFQFSF